MDTNFHNVLHGFHHGRITRTTPLEANLLQHLDAMMEAFLYDIFLNIHNACDSLDREWCLDIFLGYGVDRLSALYIGTWSD